MIRVTLATLVVFVPGIDFHDRRGRLHAKPRGVENRRSLHEPYRATMVREDGAPSATVRFDAEG